MIRIVLLLFVIVAVVVCHNHFHHHHKHGNYNINGNDSIIYALDHNHDNFLDVNSMNENLVVTLGVVVPTLPLLFPTASMLLGLLF